MLLLRNIKLSFILTMFLLCHVLLASQPRLSEVLGDARPQVVTRWDKLPTLIVRMLPYAPVNMRSDRYKELIETGQVLTGFLEFTPDGAKMNFTYPGMVVQDLKKYNPFHVYWVKPKGTYFFAKTAQEAANFLDSLKQKHSLEAKKMLSLGGMHRDMSDLLRKRRWDFDFDERLGGVFKNARERGGGAVVISKGVYIMPKQIITSFGDWYVKGDEDRVFVYTLRLEEEYYSVIILPAEKKVMHNPLRSRGALAAPQLPNQPYWGHATHGQNTAKITGDPTGVGRATLSSILPSESHTNLSQSEAQFAQLLVIPVGMGVAHAQQFLREAGYHFTKIISLDEAEGLIESGQFLEGIHIISDKPYSKFWKGVRRNHFRLMSGGVVTTLLPSDPILLYEDFRAISGLLQFTGDIPGGGRAEISVDQGRELVSSEKIGRGVIVSARGWQIPMGDLMRTGVDVSRFVLRALDGSYSVVIATPFGAYER